MEDLRVITNPGTGGTRWMPWQSGFMQTSLAMLDLQESLLVEHGFRFVLLGRITQNYLEGFFGNVRLHQKAPSASQFMFTVRRITIGQCMLPVRGSYEWTEPIFLNASPELLADPVLLPLPPWDGAIPLLDSTQKTIFTHRVGYVASRVIRHKDIKGCRTCQEFIRFVVWTCIHTKTDT
jgi:hypothetical protein